MGELGREERGRGGERGEFSLEGEDGGLRIGKFGLKLIDLDFSSI